VETRETRTGDETMTTTKLDIRNLNKWLKTNVPFYSKAVRKPHMEVIICAESGRDLTPYADAIRIEFSENIIRMDVYGLSNYITLIAR
jgi:hypothetical protein